MDAALVGRGLQQVIGGHDESGYNEEVKSVFNSQNYEQIFSVPKQLYPGTQDNFTGQSMLSSLGSQTIFTDQQSSHFGVQSDNKPNGSVKSQEISNCIEKVSILSHPKPNSQSNFNNNSRYSEQPVSEEHFQHKSMNFLASNN